MVLLLARYVDFYFFISLFKSETEKQTKNINDIENLEIEKDKLGPKIKTIFVKIFINKINIAYLSNIPA